MYGYGQFHTLFFFKHLSLESRDETMEEKLRSILAEMDYTRTVQKWDDQGVPFRSYIYVPEVHPITNTIFMRRRTKVMCLR